MLLVYAAEPIFVYQIVPDEQFLALTRLSLVSCISICVGYALPMLDGRFHPQATRFPVDASVFHALIWCSFALFAAYTLATADHIPILSSLSGADARQLDLERGDFL